MALKMAALLCIHLILMTTVASALTITFNPGTDVAVDGTSVDVQWTTDDDAEGEVRYASSLTQFNLEPQREPSDVTPVPPPGTGFQHRASLSSLLPTATYYFDLLSRTPSGTGASSSDAGGVPFTFVTGEASAGSDAGGTGGTGGGTGSSDGTGGGAGGGSTEPPRGDAADAAAAVIDYSDNVPDYHNSNVLTIHGTAEPGSILSVYVNSPADEVGGLRYAAITTAGDDGLFQFMPVTLGLPDNTVVIHERRSGSEAPENIFIHEHTVHVDTTVPEASFDLPFRTQAAAFQLTGTVSEDVEIIINVGGTIRSVNQTAGTFNISIMLQPDMANDVELTFRDKAGNQYRHTQQVYAAVSAPVILTSNIGDLNPSYVQEVTIRGTATPGATVIVSVNGKTKGMVQWSTSFIEMVEAGAGVIVEAANEDAGAADEDVPSFAAIVGPDGSFEIDVLLTKDLRTSDTGNVVGPGPQPFQDISVLRSQANMAAPQTGATFIEQGAVDSYDNTLELIVMDEFGRSSKSGPFPVTFATCGYNADWRITTTAPSPASILPEHLRRGIALTAFDVKLEWQGPSDYGTVIQPPRIDMPQISLDQLKQYTLDPQKLMRGRPLAAYRSDWQAGHVVVPFNQIEWTPRELEALASGEEAIDVAKRQLIKIPLMVDVTYEFQQPGFGQVPAKIQKTQRQCWDLSVAIEPEIPADVVPEKLLDASIKGTDAIIKGIDQVREPLKTVTIVTAIGCLAGFVGYIIKVVSEKVTCISEGFDDSDPKTIGPDCRDAHKSTRDFKKWMSLACDRIFCPAPPMLDKYAETAQKSDPFTACNKENTDSENLRTGTTDSNLCIEEYDTEWGFACLAVNEIKRSQCLLGNKEQCGGVASQAFYAMASICESQGEVSKADYFFRPVPPRNPKNGTPPLGPNECIYVVASTTFYRGTLKESITERTDATGNIVKDKTRQCDSTGSSLNDKEKEDLGITARVNKDYVIDPTGGIITSMACVCLPAVNGYLTLWRNVLSEANQCFQNIKTGVSDSGICREFIAVRLCDLIFDAIRCFFNKYGGGSGGVGGDIGIGGFVKAVASAGKDIQNSIVGRYGRTTLYQSLFNERKLVHAACLWAFTGDFDFDVEGLLTGGAAIPLESTVGIAHPTRRFVMSNPQNKGYVTWTYHVPTMIFAGAQATYSLELVCSDGDFCSEEDGFAGGVCDCSGKGEKTFPITRAVGTGTLNALDVVGITNQGDVYVQLEHPYRYDKARLRLRYRDNEGRPQERMEEVYIRITGPDPPIECSFSLLGGSFQCSFDAGDRGYAAFLQKPVPLKNVFGLNEPIRLDINVEKWSPGNDRTVPLEERNTEIPFYLTWSLRDQAGNLVAEPGKPKINSLKLNTDGSYNFQDLPGISVSKGMLVGSRNTGVEIKPLSSGAGAASSLVVRSTDPTSAGSTAATFGLVIASQNNEVCYRVYQASGTSLTGYSLGTEKPALPGMNTSCGFNSSYYKLTGDSITDSGVTVYLTTAGMTSADATIRYYAGIVTYTPLPPNPSEENLCQDLQGQSYISWYVDVSLVYCELPQDTRQAQSPGAPPGAAPVFDATAYAGCMPSKQVVNYGGQAQAYTGSTAVEVKIQCREPKEVSACRFNTLLTEECTCEATNCGVTRAVMNYCYQDTTTSPISCTTFEPCKRDGSTLDPANSLDICDCNGDGIMKCSAGRTCVENPARSGTYQCT